MTAGNRLRALALAACAATIGCGSHTSPSTTDSLSGTLAVGTSNVHTFTTNDGGDISIVLSALSPTSAATVTVGLGPFVGGSCSVQYTITGFSLNATWATSVSNAGTYCLAMQDNGTLTVAQNYTLTVTHP